MRSRLARRLTACASGQRRRGAFLVLIAVAMMAILAFAGVAIDLGMVFVACDQCQTIADAAALAGAQELPYPSLARGRAQAYADENIRDEEASQYTVETTTYARGDALPDGGTAPHGGAILVRVTKRVPYHFLPVLGLRTGIARRHAVSAKVLSGTCVCPIWITESTQVSYGAPINLLMADAPHTGIPGNFGFLQPAGNVDFVTALKGLLTPEQEEAQRLNFDNYVYAYTGLSVGQFRGALKTDWNSRLNRAQWWPYTWDTFWNYHTDNPRILLVPFVRYIDGTGSNARFQVIRFGAFWLEDVITSGNDRYIVGRFIDFTTLGAGGTAYGIKATYLLS